MRIIVIFCVFIPFIATQDDVMTESIMIHRGDPLHIKFKLDEMSSMEEGSTIKRCTIRYVDTGLLRWKWIDLQFILGPHGVNADR